MAQLERRLVLHLDALRDGGRRQVLERRTCTCSAWRSLCCHRLYLYFRGAPLVVVLSIIQRTFVFASAALRVLLVVAILLGLCMITNGSFIGYYSSED